MRTIRFGFVVLALGFAATACSSSRQLSSATTDVTSPASTPATDSATTLATAPVDTTPVDTTPVVTTTAPAPVTSVTAAPTTTAAPPVLTRPIAAIDDNGDAVLVAADGTKTLLFDGTDPDDPPPTEGDSTAVNGIAVLDDGSVAFISDCCEPVPGTMFRAVPPTPASYDSGFVGYGNGPSLSPDQTKLVRPVYDQLVVSDLDLNDIATASFDIGVSSAPYEAIFLDADTVIALQSTVDSNELVAYDISGAALTPTTSAPIPASADGSPTAFAGRGSGVVYLMGIRPATLSAFDATTLAARPDADISLPANPLSAWAQDGEVRWVAPDRTLHIGSSTIPGAYIWVR